MFASSMLKCPISYSFQNHLKPHQPASPLQKLYNFTDPLNILNFTNSYSSQPEPSPTTPITPGPKSHKIQRRLTMILKEKENLTEEERAALLKKEKLKIALEKLRVASNLKIAMKAYNVDNSSKTIWVEQKQVRFYTLDFRVRYSVIYTLVFTLWFSWIFLLSSSTCLQYEHPYSPLQKAWEVCQVLAEKNYFKPGADWTLVEFITDLQIGRK